MPDVTKAGLWHSMAEAAGLVRADGTMGETIFGQMTALAARTGSVNLGQGAPGTDAPAELIEAAAEAMRAGFNQYAPGQGFPVFLDAVATQRQRDFAQSVTREQVLFTCGATEALTASILALLPPGGIALTFEPFYDSYPAAIAAAGGSLVTVPILPTADGGFSPDWEIFESRISDPATRPSLIIVNTPHNPTGFVFSGDDLHRIGKAAEEVDAWVLTDEVYEQLILDGGTHVPPAVAMDDPSRVVTVSSAGKSWNATGWKLGWVIAEPEVREAIQAVKQFLTFTSGSPMQVAMAQMLTGDSKFVETNRDSLQKRAEVLVSACRSVPGVHTSTPSAGYFTVVDFSAVSEMDAFALNVFLAEKFSLVGIPVPALCRPGSPASNAYSSSIRYSFCKSVEDVERGAQLFRELAVALGQDPEALRD